MLVVLPIKHETFVYTITRVQCWINVDEFCRQMLRAAAQLAVSPLTAGAACTLFIFY